MKNKYVWGAAVAAVFLILLSVFAPKSGAFDKPDQMIVEQQMKWPSVQIGNFCSGTIIESEPVRGTDYYEIVILTAKHCVETDAIGTVYPVNVTIPLYNINIMTATFPAVLDYKSPGYDIAYLRANIVGDAPTARMPTQKDGLSLFFGQSVWNVSYPLAFAQTISEGLLNFIEVLPYEMFGFKNKAWQYATIEIQQGSSGSALFARDEEGFFIVGVATGVGRGTAMTLWSPWTYIIYSRASYTKDRFEREFNI